MAGPTENKKEIDTQETAFKKSENTLEKQKYIGHTYMVRI